MSVADKTTKITLHALNVSVRVFKISAEFGDYTEEEVGHTGNTTAKAG